MLLKQIFGSLSLAIALISFIPYIRDIFAGKTTPHAYSWFIWTVLQAIAAGAILRENFFWSAAGVAGTGFVSLLVFLLSLKYGTKNITVFDSLMLSGALVSIVIWIFADNIRLSVILISVIDFIGFLPTYRKGYEEPYSETMTLYVCSFLANIFVFLSIQVYSIESSLYVGSLILTNLIFVSILFTRRVQAKEKNNLIV